MFLSKLASSTKKVGDPCLRYYIYKVDISLKPTIQTFKVFYVALDWQKPIINWMQEDCNLF